MLLKYAALLTAILVACFCPVTGRVRQTADAIIVEVESQAIDSNRQGRLHPAARVPSNTFMMTDRTCWTPEGKMGRCGTIRSCYPHFKLPELTNLETWVLGTKGTCYFIEPDGRQFYGLCCPLREGVEEIFFPDQGNHVPTALPKPDFQQQASPWNVEWNNEQEVARIGCGKGPHKTLSLDEQSRIVGGTDAPAHAWTFMVSMQASGRHFCGASLISNTHVLTAAHCVAHFTSFDVPKLELVLNLHKMGDTSSAIKKKVVRITRHKGYDAKTMYNDIAILTVSSPVSFTDRIMPVCLAEGHDLFTNKAATAIGWGTLKQGGSMPNVLQQVTVQVSSNSDCKTKYASSNYNIVDHMLCAASPGKDSCQGDSGGPLIIQASPGNPWHQVGIVSWGIGCAQERHPGVYTRVTAFRDWINKNAI